LKLLLDANLSHRLVDLLAADFPELAHVRLVGAPNATDTEIWVYAQAHGYDLVTQDADFRDLQLAKGSPPKVVWLRLGNQSTMRIAATLRLHKEAIRTFLADVERECLELQEPAPRVT
jgi:predicted nuclease of predicted toxin-antitoxin system